METIKQMFSKKWDFDKENIFKKIYHSYNHTGKIILVILFSVLILSAIVLLNDVSKSFMVQVPIKGGSLTEGLVGAPRFINPLLATADTDKDLTSLIYSGLMKIGSNGNVTADLAKSYSISKDETVYDFILKDNLYFQDGTKLTTNDIEFTIKKAQDPNLKSPRRASFFDVKVEKISDKEIKFTLTKPYGTFLENLTLGILPKHIWENMDNNQFTLSPYNLQPVGSGPFKIKSVGSVKKGLTFSSISYDLVPFGRNLSTEPKVADFIFKFYQTEDALVSAYNSGAVESLSISSEGIKNLNIKKSDTTEILSTSRIFAVFFNQNQAPVLSNKEVRTALEMVTDKKEIISNVLDNYGYAIDSPIPFGITGQIQKDSDSDVSSSTIASAKALLEKNGWKINATTGIYERTVKKVKQVLSFSISTANTPRFLEATNLIKNQWEKIGADVTVKAFESGDLQQNVIATRKYDALYFGEATGRDMDMFPFWHSSQRVDGYNVALYTNSKADKIIDDARATLDKVNRTKKYQLLENEITNDIPAIFVYSPDYLYIIPNKIKGASFGPITTSPDRFLSATSWYIETDSVWKIFTR